MKEALKVAKMEFSKKHCAVLINDNDAENGNTAVLLPIGKRKAPVFTVDKKNDRYRRTCVNEVHLTYVLIMLWFYTKGVKQKRENKSARKHVV